MPQFEVEAQPTRKGNTIEGVEAFHGEVAIEARTIGARLSVQRPSEALRGRPSVSEVVFGPRTELTGECLIIGGNFIRDLVRSQSHLANVDHQLGVSLAWRYD